MVLSVGLEKLSGCIYYFLNDALHKRWCSGLPRPAVERVFRAVARKAAFGGLKAMHFRFLVVHT